MLNLGSHFFGRLRGFDIVCYNTLKVLPRLSDRASPSSNTWCRTARNSFPSFVEGVIDVSSSPSLVEDEMGFGGRAQEYIP